MLEHVPNWLGAMLHNVRAGHARLAAVDPDLTSDTVIELSSPAFASGARLPQRFTADGIGVSPPLIWGDVPAGTRSLVLIVEDPDAPAPRPLVHAIVAGVSPEIRQFAERTIVADGAGDTISGDVGRNSFFSEGWLPPDPPSGHGEHDYAFQLFALSEELDLGTSPGRTALVAAMAGKVIGLGLLIGIYSRGEAAPAVPNQSGAALA
ncbi:MAG: phospholipid-binding protein family [Sphingomonas bacterium]|uniref:YbhB/YbcL family Raf kinase inhibitor-like protein n=1 Tax=Sphingomonas bacterium TaxID=1895847 RepID=UPI002619EB87|nr:YbhB/YbcL family Raf kinase inhibitor-like protein [Sphingomonas bacterium]MDB5708641.1 phospholipid-binding protein family [Sphingomonas bacterium]